MNDGAPPPSTKRRLLPPFAETLAGLAPQLSGVEFAATIGRAELTETLGVPSAIPREFALPTVSIDLSVRTAPAPRTSADLSVVGTLGEGGMGVVLLAEQRSLDRAVAVKTTRAGAGEGADAALCEEALVTGRLEHPNVVPVHAFGRTADGRPVMVMKRIEGVSWRTLIAEPEHTSWTEISTGDRLVDHLQILTQVAHALAFAHSRGVVHRDVKPENVMVGSFGEVLLVDFGLAVRVDRVSDVAEPPRIVGTPAYMAPEMVAGMPVDQRTDVYLLGATLHEILRGEPPHDGDTLTQVLAHAYASDPPVFAAHTPSELGDLCARAMARYADDRIPTARAFRQAVQDYLTRRASHALVRRGHECLDAADTAATRSAQRSALAEARFACRQAIEQWRDNSAARALEQRVLARTVEIEVADRNAVGAREALESLEEARVDLLASVQRLDGEIAEERLGAERLRAIERDLDPSLDAGGRRDAVLALAVIAGSLSFYVSRRYGNVGFGAGDMLRIALVMSVIITVGMIAFWKRLTSNAMGRKLALVGWSTNLMMLTHRIVAYFLDESPPNILTSDSLIFTGMLVVVSLTLDIRLLMGAPLTLIGALGCALDPAHAPQWFSGSTTLLLIVASIYFRRLQRSQAA